MAILAQLGRELIEQQPVEGERTVAFRIEAKQEIVRGPSMGIDAVPLLQGTPFEVGGEKRAHRVVAAETATPLVRAATVCSAPGKGKAETPWRVLISTVTPRLGRA
jgi:hypothetical protein